MAIETYQTVTGFSIAGNYAAVVHHWNVDTPTGPDAWSNADSFRQALESPGAGFDYFAGIQAWMALDCFISSLRVRKVSAPTGPEAVKVFTPTDYPGSYGNDTEQIQVAACSKWITANPSNAVGKTFWPGLPAEALDNGNWDPTWIQEFDAFCDNLVTEDVESTVGDFHLAVKEHGVPPVYWNVIAWNISPTPGTQRRRLVPY